MICFSFYASRMMSLNLGDLIASEDHLLTFVLLKRLSWFGYPCSGFLGVVLMLLYACLRLTREV